MAIVHVRMYPIRRRKCAFDLYQLTSASFPVLWLLTHYSHPLKWCVIDNQAVKKSTTSRQMQGVRGVTALSGFGRSAVSRQASRPSRAARSMNRTTARTSSANNRVSTSVVGARSVSSFASPSATAMAWSARPSSHVSLGARSYHASAPVSYPEWDGVAKEVWALPALSPSMTTGNIAAWSIKEGDKINPGDVIAEIETDKATVAWEATESGYLAKILKPAGSKNIAVSEPVAVIVAKKELVSKFANYVHSEGASGSSAQKSAPTPTSSSASSSSSSSAPSTSSPKPSVSHTVMSMPSLSPTMEDGIIASWKKQVGDKIMAGDTIAEIETDKATVAWEATEDGYLAKILQPAGAGRVKINSPVAIVVNKKGDIDAVKNYEPGSAAPSSASSSAPSTPTSSGAASHTTAAATSSSSSSASQASAGGRVIASPYAKKLAKDKHIDLTELRGSGPNGRIIAQDVLSFTPSAVSAKAAPSAAPKAAGVSPLDAGYFEDLSVSNIRRITAERLTLSKQTIPHFYLTVDVEMDELIKVREELNAAGKGDYKLSVNDFVVKASALAMKRVPQVNSQWAGDFIRQYKNVDINVAVSTDAGLLTPIVRDADLIGLSQISQHIKTLSQNAKDGKSHPNDLVTGTFTISNLGMFGIDNFAAVINPPQACILAVGASKPKVVPNVAAAAAVAATQPFVVKNFMSVTLSCDHRVVDGAVGAKWLQVFKDLIENPMKLLL